MSKRDILTFLRNNIDYFNNIDDSMFEMLKILETKKCNLTEGNHYLVTPLLKQISEYAIVYSYIVDDEKIDLSEACKEFEEVLDVLNCCNEYMNILSSNGYNHPTVINYDNAVRSSLVYTEIFESLTNLCNEIDNFISEQYNKENEDEEDYYEDTIEISEEEIKYIEDISRKLIELGVNLDCEIVSIVEFLFKYMITNMIENDYTTKEILDMLSTYGKNKMNIVMLLKTVKTENDNHNETDDKVLFRIVENDKIQIAHQLKIGDALINFSNIFEKLEQLNKTNIKPEIKEYIKYLKEAYYLYHSYRYNYIKNEHEEKQILEKCKKL